MTSISSAEFVHSMVSSNIRFDMKGTAIAPSSQFVEL